MYDSELLKRLPPKEILEDILCFLELPTATGELLDTLSKYPVSGEFSTTTEEE